MPREKRSKGFYNTLKKTAVSAALVGAAAFAPLQTPDANAAEIPTGQTTTQGVTQESRTSSALDAAIASEPNKQFLLLRDTDHRDTALRGFMTTPEAMGSLGKGGYKHLFIECPAALGPLFDAFQDGEITREAFVDQMDKAMNWTFQRTPGEGNAMNEGTANMIETANKYGLRVHPADTDPTVQQEGLSKNRTLRQYEKDLLKGFETAPPGMSLQDYAIRYVQGLSPKEQKKLEDAFVEARTAHDETIGKEIKKTANGKPAAILYGTEHIEGIKEGLGGDKKTIDLTLQHNPDDPTPKGSKSLVIDAAPPLNENPHAPQNLLRKTLFPGLALP